MSNDRPESRDEAIARAASKLSPREAHAYSVWKGTDKPLIGPTLNSQLFQLYLNGKTTEEIRRLNPQLALGEIVAAKVEGRWDDRRDDHLDALLSETAKRVQQATLETVDFVCDLLAVANKEHGDKLRRYLQTGNANELGEFKIDNLPQLKATIEVLQKLSGQDQKPALPQQQPQSAPVSLPTRPVDAKEAGRVLRLLAATAPVAAEKKSKEE